MQDDNLRVRLYSNALPRPVELSHMSGKDSISELFDLALEFALPEDFDLELSRLVDPRARVAILFVKGPELLRVMFGRLVSAGTYLAQNRNRPQVSARFVPRAWSLTLHHRTEVYAGSVAQIIAQLMHRAMLAPNLDYELRLSTDYPEREFVLQYQETDLAFLTRLCEHWGIYFFFEHGKRDRLVFCDDNAGIQDVGVSPADPENETEAEESPPPPNPPGDEETLARFSNFVDDSSAERLAVYGFGTERQALASAFATHDYNYRTPTLPLQASAPVSQSGDGLVIEYGLHFKTPSEGEFLAARRAQALLATAVIHRGESNLPVLRAGGTLRMEEHPEQDFDLLITEVTHQVTPAGYTNHFRAQPKSTAYRHLVLSPRPRVAGLATGIIVGSSPLDPLIDEEGRYQVSLLFDAVGTGESRASRPIRMLQPHTGPDYGMHFPLKPGTEVAIGFVNGDPDRPLIVGSAPNPVTPSPVRGARQNTSRNVLKSVSGVFLEMDDDA